MALIPNRIENLLDWSWTSRYPCCTDP